VVIISDGRGINKVGTSLKHIDLNGLVQIIFRKGIEVKLYYTTKLTLIYDTLFFEKHVFPVRFTLHNNNNNNELTSRSAGSSIMVYFIRYDLSLASRYCALQ
jgi:hypothetical protein